MVVASVASHYFREPVADFVETAMYVEKFGIMLKNYEDDEGTLKLFAEPFKAQVWLAIGLSVILGGLVMWVLNRFSPCSNYGNQSQGYAAVNRLYLLHHALWFTGGAILNQSTLHSLYAIFLSKDIPFSGFVGRTE